MMDENTYATEDATEDYGWLAPNGTFYAVEWGEHQEWAQSYIEKNFPDTRENDTIDIQIKSHTGLIGARDYLVERGWVFLHNPSQGIAFSTKNPVKGYTKAQKEFLYDYYMERGKETEANKVWK